MNKKGMKAMEKKMYHDKICDMDFPTKEAYDRHLKSNLHMEQVKAGMEKW